MSEFGNQIRFLQVSDVLLDTRFAFRGLNLSLNQRLERNADALDSFSALCEEAFKRKLDGIFIAGNLWDPRSLSVSTVCKVWELFSNLGEMPVFIAPGALDPVDNRSFFNPAVMAAHGLRPWTKNVYVVPSGSARNFGPFRICLYADAIEDVSALPPGVDYTAYGGTQNPVFLRSEQGRIIAGSTGNVICRALEQSGQRHAFIVDLRQLDDAAIVSVERLLSDKRRIVTVNVSVNGMREQALPEHVAKAVRASDAKPSIDIVHIRLTGIYPAGSSLEHCAQDIASEYYQVVIEDCARPDYHIEKADGRTTQGRFVHLLQEMKHTAEAKGGSLTGTGYGASLSARTIEDALYYGLEALNQRKVTVKNVD